MTTLLDIFDADRENFTYASGPYIRERNNNRHKHVLKSKENILKLKLSKTLKRKLKKYKLRRDGTEDPDVLDVSQIFLTSLKIQSPKSVKDRVLGDNDDKFIRPKNYLFKMGRKRRHLKGECAPKDPEPETIPTIEEISCDSLSCKTQNTDECLKTQKNAFHLMMASRNKSIGSNSPGKDRILDTSETKEDFEKKSLRVKRNLVLQNMAEAKGLSKKKEAENHHDEYIKKKMDERAEKFKYLLTKKEKLGKKISQDLLKTKEEPKPSSPSSSVKDKELTRALQVINIFKEPIDKCPTKVAKDEKNDDDEEFLKKLGPSLKKKENMFCYFKKIDKECEVSPVLDNEVEDCTSNIIKVKFTTRDKKIKKKKILNKNCDSKSNQKSDSKVNLPVELLLVDEVKESPTISTERKKRKRQNLADDLPKPADDLPKPNDLSECEIPVNGRPKRNVKKPSKYSDESQTFCSSDDEFVIFTPKKKKIVEKSFEENTKLKDCVDLTVENSCREIKVKNKKKVDFNDRKPINSKATKLAPIFASKIPDAAALEAKQKFLHSGVPEQLKKIISKQQKKANLQPTFTTVVHVQQINQNIENAGFSKLYFDLKTFDEELAAETHNQKLAFHQLINTKVSPLKYNMTLPTASIQTVLQSIKQAHPKFPVYRTYKLLRDRSKGHFSDCLPPNLDNSIEVVNGILENIKNEDPENLIWTDKYKAMSSTEIIGNFESIKELKKWLVLWRETDVSKKTKTGNHSDSSDFCLSDVDTDSRDSERSTNNMLIVSGPVGCGKTSSVYAVAAELAIKVIEVNVSSRRTGKIMLQDLQEATQSHKVNRNKGNNSAENSQKSQQSTSSHHKKRGRPKKTEKNLKSSQSSVSSETNKPYSQESNSTCMSLVLVDDADIVFEQDDGFCSAITQIAQTSKRPVVLVTSSLSCAHLQKFVQCAKIIKMQPLLPRLLGTWLDLMCLAETGQCCPGFGEKLLDYFKGDIRKTVNYLHFCVQACTSKNSVTEQKFENSEDYKFSVDDECSSMSWVDTAVDDKSAPTYTLPSEPSLLDHTWSCFMGAESNIHSSGLQDLGKMYWNVPNLLQQKNNHEEDRSKTNQLELEALSRVMDSFSTADCCSNITPDLHCDLYSQPFLSCENANVTENENCSYYYQHTGVMNDISTTLVTRSVSEAQKVFKSNLETKLSYPGLMLKRNRDKIVSRHHKLNNLYPAAVLDRRSLTLDYWSFCRTICAIEKGKTDTNSKRNNRFCHYLKTSTSRCDSFDLLAGSLSFD